MSSGWVDLHMESTLKDEFSTNSWHAVPPGSAKLQVGKKTEPEHIK